jgi:hypothetical protein
LRWPFYGLWRAKSELSALGGGRIGCGVVADTLEYPNETQWNWRRDVGLRLANALDIQTKDVLGGWGADRPEPREAIEHTMRGFAVSGGLGMLRI